MKKLFICIFIVSIVFGLVACKKGKNADLQDLEVTKLSSSSDKPLDQSNLASDKDAGLETGTDKVEKVEKVDTDKVEKVETVGDTNDKSVVTPVSGTREETPKKEKTPKKEDKDVVEQDRPIINKNESKIVYKPANSNGFMTINDISSYTTFQVTGAKSTYTYYLEIVDAEENVYFNTSERARLKRVSGSTYGLTLGIPLVKWKNLPKTMIVRAQVKNGNKIYSSRIFKDIQRAGAGDLFTWEDLKYLNQYPQFSFTLRSDIKVPAGKAKPFATQDNPFTGTFNGAGHTISGFKISDDSASYLGFFAHVSDAKIENIRFTNFFINGRDFIGTVAGKISGSTVRNIYAESDISGQRALGGIAGAESGKDGVESLIDSVYIKGEISGNQDIGGIVGRQEKSIIRNAAVYGEVLGKNNVGGLVGIQTESRVESAYVGSVISGNKDVGGAVGLLGFQSEQSLEFVYFLSDLDTGINIGLDPAGYIDFGSGASDEFFDVGPLDGEEVKDGANLYGLDLNNTWEIGANGPVLKKVK